MKKINAIDSLAYGLLDGGGEVFTNFPGYMSHKLFAKLGGKITSVNEKTAYEIAWGSSFAGKRSVVMFKNVGLDDAADPFLNSMLVGVNAGLVVLVFDDVFVTGSQARQDSRHYFDFYKGLWFEPSSIQSAYDFSYKAYSLSEKFGVPVVLRITNQLVEQVGRVKRRKKVHKSFSTADNYKQFVSHPVNAKYQREVLAEKNVKIQKYVDGLYKFKASRATKKLIVFGCSDEEELNYSRKNLETFRIFTYPLPTNLIGLLSNSLGQVTVLEQGDHYATEKIESMIGKSIVAEKLASDAGNIPDVSAGYIITSNYEKLFSEFKKIKGLSVIGDLGEYTKDNLNTIDGCLSFGSSISVVIGCLMAGHKIPISIIGDAAYLHSGKNSIVEAIDRKLPVKVIVVCNGGSQGTGGQKIPGELYFQPKGITVMRKNYKDTSNREFKKIVNLMIKSKAPYVFYLEMN